MIAALILVPFIAGLITFAIKSDRTRRAILISAASLHTLLTLALFVRRPVPAPNAIFGLDALGLLFLCLTSLLFLAATVYANAYLKSESRGLKRDTEEDLFYQDASQALFTGCLLLFLSTMTLVTMSLHFGVLWVAMEATTLCSAPLIYFHRHHRSLEATWKYLIICSVGIALALLGNLFLSVSATRAEESLLLSRLLSAGRALDTVWLKAAFLFLLVGYGTKMGLAPLHTWLPDAHSEAPSLVSALLSGALLNCAFLAILRIHQVCVASGLADFSQELFIVFGIVSLFFAAFFILGQTDYKRLLAYSSVEHMGLLALGVGIGGAGAFGAMLHAVNHSFTKAALFFASGNILSAYRTKSVAGVRGLSNTLPATGLLWMAGFFSITGTPPFGTFMSEFTIFKAAIDDGRFAIAAAGLGALAVIFIGMAKIFLSMTQGVPETGLEPERARESRSRVVPALLMLAGVLLLGLHVPQPLSDVLDAAAKLLEAAP
ncbi:MAG: proton-conducting transporter membrane subunit [Fibrobacterota bacterium]